MTTTRLLMLLAAWSVAPGCSKENNINQTTNNSYTTINNITQVVGPAGGMIGPPGGPSVQIPAGALTSDTEIEIGELASGGPPTPPGTRSKIYSFAPHGLQFGRDVTVTIPHTAGGDGSGLRLLHAELDGAWSDASATDATSTFIQSETNHFSFFVAVAATGTGGMGGAAGDAGPVDAGIAIEPGGAWTTGDTPFVLGSASDRSCALTAVSGGFTTATAFLSVTDTAGNWLLEGAATPDWMSGSAACILWSPSAGIAVEAPVTWSSTAAAVQLGSTARRACFLVGVRGGVYIPGGADSIAISDSGGQWTLSGTSATPEGVSATGRCFTWPAAVPLTVTPAVAWSAPQSDTNLGSDSNTACWLTGMGGRFVGGGNRVNVYVSSGSWYLGGSTSDVSAAARCVRWM